MSIKVTSVAVAGAVLALGGWSNLAVAVPAGPPSLGGECERSEVWIDGQQALNCAGSFSETPFSGNDTDEHLNSLSEDDWAESTPVVGTDWLFGSKVDFGDPDEFEYGVLGEGSIESDVDGEFSVDVSPYDEFVISFFQANYFAYYYFENDGDGTYNLGWVADRMGDELSHISLFVRGEVPVPAPAPLVLLGTGLLGLAAVRRIQKR